MIFDLHIQSPDGLRCSISLNGRFHCEASFPLQQEWLIQALFSASRNAGLDPSSLLSHQNIIPSFPQRIPSGKKKPPALTLEDLGL